MPRETVSCKQFLWMDILEPTVDDLNFLQEEYQFHPLDLEDLIDRTQRPKLEEYDEYLFLILHFPLFDRRLRVTQPAELYIFVGENYLITIHDGVIPPLQRLFAAAEAAESKREDLMTLGTGYLLYKVLDNLVDNFFPVAYKIEHNIEKIEFDILEEGGARLVEELSIQRRDIIAFRRIIKPQMAVISRLEKVKSRLIPEDLDLYFSDIGDALARLWDIIEDQKGVLDTLNDTHNSLVQHRTNDVIKVLTVISVIMLPLTLISGLYGMNIKLPLERQPFAFEAVLLMMVAVATAMLGYFRYKRWI